MRTLVDCEFVFDILTRGPFPPIDDSTDDRLSIDSSLIEAHLASCHECRQLAEALRPSVAIFHETLSDEERATLPAFNDGEMMDRLHQKIIEAVFESEEDPEHVQRIDRACRTWLAPAMVLVPIIAMTILMAVMANPDLSAAFSRAIAATPAWDRSEQVDIRAMGLPDGCLTPVVMAASIHVTQDTEPTSTERIAACTDCHTMKTASDEKLVHATQKHCADCHRVTPDHTKALPIDATHYQCCTSCHSVGKVSIVNVAKLASACKSCHE